MKAGGELIRRMLSKGDWRILRGDTALAEDEWSRLIGPNSIDVTLGNKFIEQAAADALAPIDPHKPWTLVTRREFSLEPGESFVLRPGQFVLGHTRERVQCLAPAEVMVHPKVRTSVTHARALGDPPREIDQTGPLNLNLHFAPQYEGRSTMGRLGVCSHATAGYGDYGFSGAFTLELFTVAMFPIILRPGMRIGQISLEAVLEPGLYKGAYSGTDHYDGPVPPKLGKDRF